MGALDRMLVLQATLTRIEVPMLQIVPDPDTSANSSVPPALREAFAAEVKRRVAERDFAERERSAMALANEVVCAELTRALEEIGADHDRAGHVVPSSMF